MHVFLTGATGYLGSSGGLMALATSANTVTQNTAVTGKVLAVSPDSNRVIVGGSNTLWVLGVGGGINTETSPIASATAADFTPDSRGAYIVAGNNLYFWSPGSFRTIQLGGVANDVKFLPNGVFAYLAARPNTAVSRVDLVEAVWGYGKEASTSNVVETVVRSVRQKLGPHRNTLETVRGVGYSLREESES